MRENSNNIDVLQVKNVDGIRRSSTYLLYNLTMVRGTYMNILRQIALSASYLMWRSRRHPQLFAPTLHLNEIFLNIFMFPLLSGSLIMGWFTCLYEYD